MNNEKESEYKIFKRRFLKNNFRLENFELLGEGGFGKVYAFPEIKTGDVYAIKIISPNGVSFNKRAKELAILLSLNEHPHIVQLKNYFCDSYKNQIVLVMEKADETLSSILETGPLNFEDLKKMIIELTKGLQYAHSKGISHSDLKPSNILAFKGKTRETLPIDKNYNISAEKITYKLSDWGSSHFLGPLISKTLDNKTLCYLSPGYTDPNILTHNPKNFGKSDIYSLGMIVMRACGVPDLSFAHISEIKNKQEHEKEIKSLLNKYKIENKYGENISKLIEKMTKFDQKERLEIEEILTYFEDKQDKQENQNKFQFYADEIKVKIAHYGVNFIYNLYNELERVGKQMIPILSDILELQMKNYQSEIMYASNKMELAEAHFLLGKMYSEGIGIEQNKLQANTLYEKAHILGNEMGTFQLGLNHFENKEFNKAVELYIDAENKANSKNVSSHNCLALINLAGLYLNEDFPQKDPEKAKKYYELGVSCGNTICASNLGLLYLKGCFGKNKEYGKKLVQEAAQKGNTHAIDIIKKYDLKLY